MITQIGGVDLAANIAAIESLGNALKNLSKEYYTNQGTRFGSWGYVTASTQGCVLFNIGDAADKLLVEKMWIHSDTAILVTTGFIDDTEGMTPGYFGYSCSEFGVASTKGQIYQGTMPSFAYELIKPGIDIGQCIELDLGGILISQNKGFGIDINTDAMVMCSFLWRETT